VRLGDLAGERLMALHFRPSFVPPLRTLAQTSELHERYDQDEEKPNSQQQDLSRFNARRRQAGVLMDCYPPRFPSENQAQEKNAGSPDVEAQEDAPEDEGRDRMSETSGVRHDGCRIFVSWRRLPLPPGHEQGYSVFPQSLSIIRQI
jgi:hypothetical protein